MSKKIVFATCRTQPDFQPGDAILAETLRTRGHQVAPAPWNGPQAVFAGADAIILRSTWDYHRTPEDFADWLSGFAADRRMFNPASLARWNMSKRYLLELAEKGAVMPPLRRTEPSAESIAAAMEELGLDQAVVKPEYGATGSGLSLVTREDEADLAAAAVKLGGAGFVQALIPEIRTAGETSFIFIAGEFAHAVTKRPKSGEILCQSDHGGSVELTEPTAAQIDAARRILAMIPANPLYARADAVLADGAMQLMEVELIEPELFFTYAPGSADRFAAALLERL